MIQARKLGHVVLNVRNSQRSKLFYMQVLGLRLVHEDPQRREVFLSFGREHHELGLFEATVAGPGDDAARSVLHHTAWQLGNDAELRAAYERLKQLGIPIESTATHTATRSIHFFDPDGNRVELYCDTVENGFEAMRLHGTRRDPLDLEALPGAAAAAVESKRTM
jgi:catechol 2,3-dioxygenase